MVQGNFPLFPITRSCPQAAIRLIIGGKESRFLSVDNGFRRFIRAFCYAMGKSEKCKRIANSLGREISLPDSWQRKALAFLRDGKDAVLHAPTGAGKTYVFEQLLESVEGAGRLHGSDPGLGER